MYLNTTVAMQACSCSRFMLHKHEKGAYHVPGSGIDRVLSHGNQHESGDRMLTSQHSKYYEGGKANSDSKFPRDKVLH